MLELNDIFESETATRALVIDSIVFMVLNVLLGAILISMREGTSWRSSRPATQMRMVATLVLAAAFLAAGVGIGTSSILSHRNAAAIAAPTATISIEVLHRQINVNALPLQDIKDLI